VPDTRELAAERLADHTTIRLGGPAGSFVRAETEAELIEAVEAADADGTPVLVLGGGSNLVVADAGFDGLVVRVDTTGLRFESGQAGDAVALRVAAGQPWDDVVLATLAEGLAGLESLSGIPGLAGATPIQNVGAYGAEIAELVTGVRVFDRLEKVTRLLSARACEFGYRTSALKGHDRYLVLGVELELRPQAMSAPLRYAELATALGVPLGARAPIAEVRAAVLILRARKGMLIDDGDPDSVSAGSFFTNPVLPAAQLPDGAPSWPSGAGLVKTSAAWLIEQAGFRPGHGVGPVGLSTKHTLALVNRGSATTDELVDFARTIRDGVARKFGIALLPEPALIGVRL
jgi:UDP-N-acetylmuramate dehydrogenase